MYIKELTEHVEKETGKKVDIAISQNFIYVIYEGHILYSQPLNK